MKVNNELNLNDRHHPLHPTLLYGLGSMVLDVYM